MAPPFLADISSVTARPLHLVLWGVLDERRVLADLQRRRECRRACRGRLHQTRGGTAAPRSSRAGHVAGARRSSTRAPEARQATASRSRRCRARRLLLAKGDAGPLARGAAAAGAAGAERIAAQLGRGGLLHGHPGTDFLVWGAGVLGATGGGARVRWAIVHAVVAKFAPASMRGDLAVDP